VGRARDVGEAHLCWSKELVWKFVVEAVEALADLRMFGKWIKAKGPGRALEVVVALEKSPLSHLGSPWFDV